MPKAGKTARPSPRQAAGARRPGQKPRSAPRPGRRRSGATVVAEAPPMPAPTHAVPCAPLDGLPPVQEEAAPPVAPVLGESGVNNTQLPITISPAPNPQVVSITPPSVVVSSPTLGVTTCSSNTHTEAAAHMHTALTSVCDELGIGVSRQIQEKIWNGEFVEFGSLLRPARSSTNAPDDCVFMVGSHESPVWQIRPHAAQNVRITSIEQWTSAFLVFASIYLMRHSDRARQLLKYADTIRSAAFRRVGFGWRDYDIQFRLRQARMPTRSWASIDAELWLMLVGAPTQTNFRPFSNKPITQQRGFGYSSAGAGRSSQLNQRAPSFGTCFDFNRGQCFRAICRYAHKCSTCMSFGHSANHCRGISRTARGAATPTATANPGKLN